MLQNQFKNLMLWFLQRLSRPLQQHRHVLTNQCPREDLACIYCANKTSMNIFSICLLRFFATTKIDNSNYFDILFNFRNRLKWFSWFLVPISQWYYTKGRKNSWFLRRLTNSLPPPHPLPPQPLMVHHL